MKRKHLLLPIAALLAACGFWFARSTSRPDDSASDNPGATYVQTPGGQPQPGQTNTPRPRHAPPNPTQKFRDFTPEQRVEFARKGHGPGG